MPSQTGGEIILAGRDAWQRLKERDRKAWPDWCAVGHALIAGRSEAMRAANTNCPFGLKYTRAIGEWLSSNGLDGIPAQERYRIIVCIENLTAIEEWMATLAPEKRLKLNHPNTVWGRWKQSTKPTAPCRNAIKGAAERGLSGRPIFWGGDAIKRAATAIRESYSTDFYVMARRALEAAVRTESDLMALLPDEPPKASALQNGRSHQRREEILADG